MSPGAQDTVESLWGGLEPKGPRKYLRRYVSFHFFSKTNILCIVNKQFTQSVFLFYKSIIELFTIRGPHHFGFHGTNGTAIGTAKFDG